MRRYFFSILLMMVVLPTVAQSARDFIRMGNKAFVTAMNIAKRILRRA